MGEAFVSEDLFDRGDLFGIGAEADDGAFCFTASSCNNCASSTQLPTGRWDVPAREMDGSTARSYLLRVRALMPQSAWRSTISWYTY